jgi:hypothetical protein
MIVKTFRAYGANFLRQEKSLHDNSRPGPAKYRHKAGKVRITYHRLSVESADSARPLPPGRG